jgi:hypothetical protein
VLLSAWVSAWNNMGMDHNMSLDHNMGMDHNMSLDHNMCMVSAWVLAQKHDAEDQHRPIRRYY